MPHTPPLNNQQAAAAFWKAYFSKMRRPRESSSALPGLGAEAERSARRPGVPTGPQVGPAAPKP